MMFGRSSQTKTGGLASLKVSMVSSLPTTCGWTNDAKNPTFGKATGFMVTVLSLYVA